MVSGHDSRHDAGQSDAWTGARRFIEESNRIEGINRTTDADVAAHDLLWRCRDLSVEAVEAFVAAVAARPLRRHVGQNVRVGAHVPPPGGPNIEHDLKYLIVDINCDELTPYEAHVVYEQLHPFMDGNGRSGRAVWAWMMLREGRDPFALPFLQLWYYDSLGGGGER